MKTSKNHLVYFLAIISGIALLGGCNGTQKNNSAAPKPIDVQALISKEEAASLTQYTYSTRELKETSPIGQKICDYSNSNNGLFQVTLIQQSSIPINSGLKTPKAFFDAAKQIFPKDNVTITNLNTDAFIDKLSIIHILYSDYYISIAIMQDGTILDPKRWTANEKKLILTNSGTKVLENLKKLLVK